MREANAMDFKKRITDIFAAFNAHDVETYLSFQTEDVYSENLAIGIVTHGKKEARAYFKRAFAEIPDCRIELTSCFASGAHECSEYVMSGTHMGDLPGLPATGKCFSVRVVSVAELRDGKTRRLSTYFDSASLLRQLGVSPGTPPRKSISMTLPAAT